MSGELDDIRVIELSRTAAAAFAGRLCAIAGADVFLIEPTGGHPLRHEGPFPADEPDIERSAAHLHINAGKRSLAFDFREVPDLLLDLLDDADVFVTDIAAHELDTAGLSWPILHERQPDLVMTRVTPFGDTGPKGRYAGTNLTILAAGGQLKVTGDPDKPPLSNFGSQAEYQGGLSAFAGTLGNLLLRDAGGEGSYLDLSIQDVVSTNLEHRAPALNLGLVANRAGLSVSATYGVYPCADGWVYVTAFAPALWERLKTVASIVELDDERFASQEGRLAHNDELQAVLTSWTVTKTSQELHALALDGSPFTVAQTLEALLRSEQWRARSAIQRVSADGAPYDLLRSPWHEDAAVNLAPAPRLGEGNDAFHGARAGAAS
jgi:crotonobetainyl-CoA:carnitine CoA-transferase CaiB-like acyl-CoA transferase